MRKTRIVGFFIALLITAVFLSLEHQRGRGFLVAHADTAHASRPAYFMQRLEWASLDWRFKMRGPRPPHPDVVILAIDDQSLAQLHQWPWPRRIHAQLINRLHAHPPKALVFDVLFIEPYTADLAGDHSLVEASAANPWVVHAMFFNFDRDSVKRVTLPFPELLDNAPQLGFVNAFIDEDGVLRTGLPFMEIQGHPIALISVVGTSLYLGKSVEDVVRPVPRDARGQILLNFAGPDYTFPYIPYADVLTGKFPASKLEGKIVLVGASATGTFDHYPTPMSKFMPGVEFHANVIQNLLETSTLKFAGLKATYIAILITGLLCGLLFPLLSAGWGAFAAVLVGATYTAVAQMFFTRDHYVIDMAGPLLTLELNYLLIVIYRFFTEEREKRWVKAAFGQYVSPKVLQVLMEDPAKLRLGGERREMTVLFSDVAGFTSISERLSPEALVSLLNRYLTAMTDVVFEYDGYLNKYMGDGIMAFWNAPLKQADHAARACRCALKSQAELAALNAELTKEGLTPLKARIGLNTGVMVVGNMGSSQKSDYTVMGDNVNLGSRLEGANKSFGTFLMISEFTYQLVQDQFEVRFLDIIRVPGKAKPVKTYELFGEKGSLSAEWKQALPLYHEAIQLFTGRRFDEAQKKFEDVICALKEDTPSRTYLNRIEHFRQAPPPDDWDGVFELKVK